MQAHERGHWQSFLHYCGLYRIYFLNYGRRLVQYRSDTVVALLGGLLMQGGFLVFIQVLYKRIPHLNGFTQSDLLFLFGFVTLGRELNRMFLDAPFHVIHLIRQGRFDVFLLRPCSTLFQVVAGDSQILGIGGAVVGLAAMLMALPGLSVPFDSWRICWLAIAIICNVLIQFSILMSIASLAFRWSEVNSLLLPLSWLYEFNRYPLTVFHPVVQGVLTFLPPFALGAFYPVAYLLYPAQYAWVPLVVPVMAATALVFCLWLWNAGIERYTSMNA